MSHFVFTFLSVFTVACALGVVLSKNAVNGAMCLLLCLGGVAGLFVGLHAYLLGFVLLWVYAGAVVMLFLFIVMLLDMQGGPAWRYRAVHIAASLAAAALLILGLDMLAVRGRFDVPASTAPPVGGSMKHLATELFTTYLLPIEVIGFLLLIAMLGVVVLSKRTEGAEGAP
jgi:NADH-quinone oxidoreductase subunit J